MTGDRELSSAGWYPDPDGSGNLRWWDGTRWTEEMRAPSSTSDRLVWLERSPVARAIGLVAVCAAAVGVVGSTLIGLLALIRQELPHGVDVLLVPAVLVVIAVQSWVIVLLWARMPRVSRGWRDLMRTGRDRSLGRILIFGGLSTRAVWLIMAVTFLGWLYAMAALVSMAAGGSADTWKQRFAAGILLMVFTQQLGAALGGLTRRRPASP